VDDLETVSREAQAVPLHIQLADVQRDQRHRLFSERERSFEKP
jgi:hypothetical protein